MYENILNSNLKVTYQYLEIMEDALCKYGDNTIVFYEMGSFFEMYDVNENKSFYEMCELLNLTITRKDKSNIKISKDNPRMAGIPTISLEKSLSRIESEKKWHIVLIKQRGGGSNVERYFDKVISPSITESILSHENNYLASVFLEQVDNKVIMGGVSLMELSTGELLVYDNYGNVDDPDKVVDDIHRIILDYNVNELIMTTKDVDDNKINNKFDRLGININLKKYEVKYHKIFYIEELLKTIYSIKTPLTMIEELDLERSEYSLHSLSILLRQIIEQNKFLLTKIKKPVILKNSSFMYIGNNALEQLNIVEGNVTVNEIINKAITAVGKRYVRKMLINPLNEANTIQNIYLSSQLLNLEDKNELIKKELKKIYDIERLKRKIELNKINPNELYQIFNSFKSIFKLESSLNENFFSNINDMNVIIKNIEDTFILDFLSVTNDKNFKDSFIKDGVSNELDILLKEYSESEDNLKEKFLKFISVDLRFASYFKLKKDNSNLYFLDISKSKLSLLIQEFGGEDNFYKELKCERIISLSNSFKIYSEDMNSFSKEILYVKNEIERLNFDIFYNFINSFDFKFDILIKELCLFEQCYVNSVLLNEHNYCMPEIVESDESFIETLELRHPIVEKINDKEEYISNDILLGDSNNFESNIEAVSYFDGKKDVRGMLLYGLNSSGKSTQMKALGIALILAQSGFYVPASKFRYGLFNSLFTRISSSDRIENGLSTFALEMLEMKNILNRSDKKSLILGDEIAHGTETISALSIVSSAIKVLSERDSFFLFATHLHQLKEISILDNIDHLQSVHLSISVDDDTGDIKYDRKLKPGHGSSMYGLEFAKSMNMDRDFLELSYKIRNEISEDLDKYDLIYRAKKSNYNAKKFVLSCEICGKMATEEHHIKPQNLANNVGNIGSFHKNRTFNLMNLCEKCHDNLHK